VHKVGDAKQAEGDPGEAGVEEGELQGGDEDAPEGPGDGGGGALLGVGLVGWKWFVEVGWWWVLRRMGGG